jgi:phage terminase small subunit
LNMAKKPLPKSVPVKKKRGVGQPRATKDRPLTRKQELFVKELVSKDGQITMREAAINAGYPAGSAHTRAYEMTNPHICPHVVAAIKAYRDELDEKYGINYRRHIRDLQTIRDMALQNGAYSAAVQAEYRRGQAQGDIYVSKSEIRHGSIDSMSKEDVMKALEEIKQTYAPVTIDITPEGEDNSQNRAKARSRIVATDEEGDGEEFEEDHRDTA